MRKAYILLLMLIVTTLVFGQAQTTGRATGKVVDEKGAPIKGAKATLISMAIKTERTATTDDGGKFTFTLLPPGDYAITVASEGKQSVDVAFRVGIGQTIPLDFTLKPGLNIVEQVTVYGSPSKLETTVQGENFNYPKQVESLPVVNRGIERVAELSPNISFGPTPNTLAIAGAPSFDTVVLLDGAEVSDPYYGSAPDLYLEEAVNEVQVMTAGVSARYGRFQGGVINATTKSGGNAFDGTARVDITKESWNAKTPYPGQTQSDTYNKVYSATVGGPILKNYLWFFAGGRIIPTQNTTGFTANTDPTLNYTTKYDEKRWQVKLTGAITPDHVISVSYLYFKGTSADRAGLPAADLLSLAPREDPRNILTMEYQGVLTQNLSLNVQGTRKRVKILSGGTSTTADPFLDYYGSGYQIWHNGWWDYNDASLRNNDTISANLTQILSTGNWGDHTLEYGVEYVDSTTAGENKQSPSGFNLLNYDAVVGGTSFSDLNPTDPRFNLISYADGGLTYRWQALSIKGEQNLKNTAVYVQDGWQKGKWRIDLGLRYEKYKGTGPNPTLNMDFNQFSPRLGITYNIDPSWQVQATWGRYVSRFNDNVASTVSGIGGAPYVVKIYTGPTGGGIEGGCAIGEHCLTYDQVQAANRNDANWGIFATINDPKQPTRFLAGKIHAPYADDLNLTLKRALPKNRGTITVGYIFRSYKDLLDDYVGGQGIVTATDPFGEGSLPFDKTIWKNSNQARRQYEAITATFDYRPGARFDLGGNWTYSWTQGNYEGEGRNTPASGSIIGNYPLSVDMEHAVPYGYLNEDIRSRVRAWGNYRFDLGKAGNLTVGALATAQSALPYSKTTSVSLKNDPTYVNDVGKTYTYYYYGRGNSRYNGFWRLDLSGRYEIKLFKDLNAYVKLTVTNVTGEHALTAFSTSGASVTVNGIRMWTPANPATYRTARNAADYQTARSLWLSAGLTF